MSDDQPLFPLHRDDSQGEPSSYPQVGGYPTVGAMSPGGGGGGSARSSGGGFGRVSSSQVAMIVAGVAAVIAVVIAAVLVFGGGSSGESNARRGATQGSSAVSVRDVAPCSSTPHLQPESINFGSNGLTLRTQISPNCSSGDLLTNSRFRIAVTDSVGRDVAAGVFDLSANPIAVGNGGRTMDFVFPAGTYWRTADAISGDIRMSAHPDGQNTAAVGDTHTSTVTAAAMGMPESGDIDAAAHSALVDIVAADRRYIDQNLMDAWQPQLSSKRPGLYADGVSWTYPEIVREHMQLRQRFPAARLVWSGDWSVFSDPTWWVTVGGMHFDSGPAVLDFCASEGFDGDHCLAKILSHTMGTSGTTMLRK